MRKGPATPDIWQNLKPFLFVLQTDAVAVQSAADSAGESLNAYIVGAVAQRMERDANSAPKSPAEALPPEVENMLE